MSAQPRSVTLRAHQKLAYGLGSVGDSAVHFSFETFVFFYYTQILGVSGTLAGFAVMIAMVFDAISDPIAGSLSDSTRSRWGRRHPFMFAGPVPLAVCFYLLFVPPDGLSEWELFAWLALFCVLSRTFLTMFAVPWLSLGAELTQDYTGRTWLVAMRMSFGAIGHMGAAAVGFFVFFQSSDEFPVGHLDPGPYPAYAAFIAIVVVGVQFVSALGTLEPARARYVAPSDGDRFSLRRLLRELRGALRQRSFRIFVLAGLVFAAAVGVRQTLGLHMNTFFWELSSEETGRVMVVMLFGLVLGFPLWARVSQYLGKRRTFQAGLLMMGASVLLPPVLRALGWFPENDAKAILVPMVTLFALFAAVGGTGAHLAQGSMAADIADENALDTGLRQEGIFFGALNFMAKCSSGLGHQLAGISLDAIGLLANAVPGEVPDSTVANLGWIYGGSACAIAFLAIGLINRYGLTRERIEEIQQKLAERSRSDDSTPNGSARVILESE